jgi:hypothetical protein
MLAGNRPPMHAIRRRHVGKLGMAAVSPLGMDACRLTLLAWVGVGREVGCLRPHEERRVEQGADENVRETRRPDSSIGG